METKIIKAVFGGGTSTVTNKRTRTDYGQVLEIIGIDLPDTFECIFSNSATSAGVGKKMIGSNQRCLIPDEYLKTGQPIYAWVLLHDSEDDGRHMYSIRIPVADMPDTSPEEPTPVEQSIISQAITALNSAVTTTTQKAQEASASADQAEQAAEGVEGFAERAEAAQGAAESARDRAVTAETNARTSAATASEKASEAISSATTASQSAITAENASESAQEYASASAESASQASQSAESASESASASAGNANFAASKALDASNSASEAAQSASTAVQAKTDAETAKTASETAQRRAESARDEAVTAKTSAESARDEVQNLVDGITGKVEQIDSNTDRIESLEDDRYKPYAVDTASGSIASFPDGADDILLKSCIVQIEPVQDLHGYDSPWPGGGGKNKLLFFTNDATDSKYGMEVSYNAATEVITVTGTETHGSAFSVISSYRYRLPKFVAGETYTISRTQVTGNLDEKIYFQITYRNLDGGSRALVLNNAASTTFTVPNDFDVVTNTFVGVFAGVSNVNNAFKLQLELGSTATDYTPYENICPISGWTGCEVQRTGVNVWDEEWEIGTINVSTGEPAHASDRIRSKNLIPCLPNTLYYVIDPTSGNNVRLFFYANDGSFISAGNWTGNAVQTTPVKARFLRFIMAASYGTAYKNDISINYPSTDHDYHPYTGQTYPITFPPEAGTVYGGYIDPINGELVVDKASEEFLFINPDTNNGFDSKIFTLANTATPTTSKDGKITNVVNEYVYAGASYEKPHFYIGGKTFVIYLKENTYRGGTVQVCYPLAEPIHYPLTPTEIKTLLGTNNIWSNTGDTSVEYRADTKLYITKKITEAVSALS